MRNRFNALARLILVLVVELSIFQVGGVARAQSGGWTAPFSISGDLTGPSQFPKIAQDSMGNLHVVWTENSFVERGVADAIYYSRFDGTNWSPPVDVLVSPDQQQSSVGELVVLPNDELALIWTGGQQILFSTVAAVDAQQASAWQTTPLFSEFRGQKAFIIYEQPETLDVVFVDAITFSVMFASSDDLGASWTEPVEIWTRSTDAFAADDPRLCVDPQGMVLHTVWHENAREQNWNPNGIWYVRSLDQGVTWSDQFYLQNGGSSPNCAYDGEGKLHILWNNAVGSVDGRYHRWSANDGKDWSDAVPIFAGLSGRTRAPAFGVDSLGELYVLTGAQSDNQTRMFVSHWQGDSWATPFSISGDLDFNESPDIAVTNGNQLHAVWHIVNPDLTNIWYSTYQTDAPMIASSPVGAQLQQLPTPSLLPTPVPELARDVVGVSEADQTQVVPDFTPTRSAPSAAISPVLVGTLAGLSVTLIGLMGVVLSRRRR